MSRKIKSLLVLMLVFCMFPVQVFAADVKEITLFDAPQTAIGYLYDQDGNVEVLMDD